MKRYTGNSITADINSELIPFLNLNIKQWHLIHAWFPAKTSSKSLHQETLNHRWRI